MTRRVRWVSLLVVPAALGAGTLYRVLAPGGDRESARRTAVSAVESTASENPTRMAEAVRLSKGRGLDSTDEVVAAYAAWANDPSAVPERRLLLSALFAENDIAKKLNGVLAAVEADPTPPEKDPLWERMTRQLSELWKGDVATKAMDLVLAETRPRARRALISSFVVLATSERLAELTHEQRQTLTETMIDVTPHAAPGQKAELDRALRKLGGNDLADIMAGKGITGQDGHLLESERAYNDSLQQTKRELEKGPAAAP